MNTQNVKTAAQETAGRWGNPMTAATENGCEKAPGQYYSKGMKWRGITLGKYDAEALNNYDRDIAKAVAPEARSWLIQNKAEYVGLMLGIETVRVG